MHTGALTSLRGRVWRVLQDSLQTLLPHVPTDVTAVLSSACVADMLCASLTDDSWASDCAGLEWAAVSGADLHRLLVCDDATFSVLACKALRGMRCASSNHLQADGGRESGLIVGSAGEKASCGCEWCGIRACRSTFIAQGTVKPVARRLICSLAGPPLPPEWLAHTQPVRLQRGSTGSGAPTRCAAVDIALLRAGHIGLVPANGARKNGQVARAAAGDAFAPHHALHLSYLHPIAAEASAALGVGSGTPSPSVWTESRAAKVSQELSGLVRMLCTEDLDAAFQGTELSKRAPCAARLSCCLLAKQA